MRHFATCAHASQVPVLLASMRRHCGDFRLYVLAWDYEPPPDAKDAIFTARSYFLGRHPEMHPDRLPGPPRRAVDVVATVRWTWLVDLLTELGEPVTLIDGDLFMFASPEPVFAEIGAAKMAVTPHRIPTRDRGLPGVALETHWVYGRHNAGWAYFADPAPAREMAARTREWSYTEVVRRPDGRRPLFGDQSALEDVAEKYGAHVIGHPGVNLGPWNIHNAKVIERSGMVLVDLWPTVDCRPLVAYHFSSLSLNASGSAVQLANPEYEVERAAGAVELIYEPYLREVAAAARGECPF